MSQNQGGKTLHLIKQQLSAVETDCYVSNFVYTDFYDGINK